MSCQQSPNALLICNVEQSTIKENFVNIIYTDLLLNQRNINNDFDKLVREIDITTPSLYNFLIVCDEISMRIFQTKLSKRDNVHCIEAAILRQRYEGKARRSDGKKIKVVNNPILNAFKLNTIHSFKNHKSECIILFFNVYKIFFIERFLKDNEKTQIKCIHVVLNSLVEFSSTYTLEKPFKIILCNDVVNEEIPCNFHPHGIITTKKIFNIPNQNNKQNYITIDINDIVNNIPSNIIANDTHVFNLAEVQKIISTDVRLYRLFKMFYYTYCFNGAQWSIVPNNKDIETLYIFKRYFHDEMLIISKWWPDSETVSLVYDKLQKWCPQIFGKLNNWFFHCDVHSIFSMASANIGIRLPLLTFRPILAGGHIWNTSTLAYIIVTQIGIGTSIIRYSNIQEDNKKDTNGYYKFLFKIDIL